MARAHTGRLGVVIVRGASMLPTLRDGHRLLVRYGSRPRVGSLVVARLPDGTIVIKRAFELRATGWWLLSDNPSVGLGDSRAWGAVPQERILAVAVARLWPRPARLSRTPPAGA